MAKGVGNLARIALNAGRLKDDSGERDVVDIITFIEAEWGLSMKLYPIQKLILKAHYGIPLDDNPINSFSITDWKGDNERWFTEKTYLEMLYSEGRSNIKEVTPGQERRNLILSIGRRSGKTTISACIAAYETYKLINKGWPQHYYGFTPNSMIQLISVATGKDQAGLLYQEVSGTLPIAVFQAVHSQPHAVLRSVPDSQGHRRFRPLPREPQGTGLHQGHVRGL